MGAFEPQKLHRYTYCLNNPVNLIDPLGLDVEPAPRLTLPTPFIIASIWLDKAGKIVIFWSRQCYLRIQAWFIKIKIMLQKPHEGKGVHFVIEVFKEGRWKKILELRHLLGCPFPIFILPPGWEEPLILKPPIA